MGRKRKSSGKKKPDVNKELEGLDININTLGEIQSTYDIDAINDFLNKHTKDKKLEKRKDNEEE
jgi:hypothetical protein